MKMMRAGTVFFVDDVEYENSFSNGLHKLFFLHAAGESQPIPSACNAGTVTQVMGCRSATKMSIV